VTIIHYLSNTGSIKAIDVDPYSIPLNNQEVELWSHREERGIFNKHLSKIFRITNLRVYVVDYELNKVIGTLMMSDLSDVVILNTRRMYNSQHVGGYSSFAKGLGMSGGISRGIGVTVADVMFMIQGQPIIIWRGVIDPSGIRRLVLSVKKQIFPKKELGVFLHSISGENPQTGTCVNCGARNKIGSSFCASCGYTTR